MLEELKMTELLEEGDRELVGVLAGTRLSGAMTPYQIHNFVLNRREFCTPLAQYVQAKREVALRLTELMRLSFEYRRASALKKIAQAELERLGHSPQDAITEAQRELKKVELDEHEWTMACVRQKAKELLAEAREFYTVVEKYRYFENMTEEELAKLEDEAWRVKSAYFPELRERYQITLHGRVPLPHERRYFEKPGEGRLGY